MWGRGWGRGRGRGMGGLCWYLLSQGITEITVGGQKIKVIPGTGVGRLIKAAFIQDIITEAAKEKKKEE